MVQLIRHISFGLYHPGLTGARPLPQASGFG